MAATAKEDELETYGSVIIVQEDADTHMSTGEEDAPGEFLCEECGGSFKDKSSLGTHLKTHRDDYSYCCHSCNKGFYDINDYESHLLEHENKEPTHEEGEPSFIQEQDLGHQESTLHKPLYRCDLCNQMFTFKSSLKRHKRLVHRSGIQSAKSTHVKDSQAKTEKPEKAFSSDSCDKKFAFRGSLKMHKVKDQSNVVKKTKCYYCFKEFRNKVNLRRHMEKMHCLEKMHGHKTSEVRGQFSCGLCDSKFYFKRSLKRHIRQKHGGSTDILKCNHCEQEFQSTYFLYRHISSVHVDLMLKCKECGLLFRNMSTLWRHMDVHKAQFRHRNSKDILETSLPYNDSEDAANLETDVKYSIASESGISSSVSNAVKEIQARVYGCDFCSQKFVKKTHLLTHQSTEHFSELFILKCNQCDRLFESNHEMIMHMRSVHSEHELHSCRQCDMLFGLKGCPLKCVKSSASGKTDLLNLVLTDLDKASTSETPEAKDAETTIEHFVTDDPEDPFNYEATKLLIEGIQRRYDRMTVVHRRPLVYQEVGEELMRYGYNISAQHIKKKWCKIVSYFWSLRNRPDRHNWEFFEQLNSFLEVENQSPASSEGDDFNRESTLTLIECVRKHYHLFSQTNLRDRRAMYAVICQELRDSGYNFSVQKVRRKWNNLLGRYKQDKSKTSVTEIWEFFKPINDFMDPGSSGPSLKEIPVKKFEKYSLSPPPPSTSLGTRVPVTKQPFVFSQLPSDSPVASSSGSPTVFIPAPSGLANVSPVNDKASTSSEGLKRESSSSGITKRLALMEDYFSFLKEKESEERGYRKRKEGRSRMKLRLLKRIGTQLEIVARTQNDILVEQAKILKAINQSNANKK